MAIQYVNGATTSNLTGTSITSLSTPSFNATTGNLIIVGFRSSDGATVSDTAGNTYTRVVNAFGVTNVGTLSFFYAKNITGNANNVVTVSFNSGGYQEVCVAQYSGCDKNNPLDVGGSTNTTSGSSSSSITSPSFSTTTANQLIICFATVSNNTTVSFTAGSGYTLRNTGVVSSLQERIVSSTQSSVTASISASTNYYWGLSVMTFKEELTTNSNFFQLF